MEHDLHTKPLPRYTGFDQLSINGKWRQGKGTNVLRDLNPYNGKAARIAVPGLRLPAPAHFVV